MAAIEFETRQSTWPELDFTSTPSDHRNLAVTSQCFDPRIAMDMRDPLAWMGADDGQTDRACGTMSPIYQTGPFTLSDLQDMEPENTPSDQSSQSTTSPSNSHSMSTEKQTDQSGQPSQLGKVCPLLAGQTFECSPQLCGPNAACLDFAAIPEIEDCAEMSFIPQNSSNGPEVTRNIQAAPVSTSDKTSSRASTSQFKESTRNSQHRNRTNADDPDAKSHSKKAHSLVERRYRENLNGNIAQLHLALLKTKRVSDGAPEDEDDDLEEPRQALSKVRKSDVMLEAVDYVHQTEVELRHMANEIELLTSRVKQLEKLVKCEECPLVQQLVNMKLAS